MWEGNWLGQSDLGRRAVFMLFLHVCLAIAVESWPVLIIVSLCQARSLWSLILILLEIFSLALVVLDYKLIYIYSLDLQLFVYIFNNSGQLEWSRQTRWKEFLWRSKRGLLQKDDSHWFIKKTLTSIFISYIQDCLEQQTCFFHCYQRPRGEIVILLCHSGWRRRGEGEGLMGA